MRKKKPAEEYDYREDLEIDPNALDIEFLEQPNKFMKYADLAAKAKKKVEQRHEELKVVRSEIVLEINKAGELPDGSKATVNAIEAYYRTREEHQEAKKALAQAQYEADLLDAAKMAFYHRKSSLENLASLMGMQYFSAPKEPRDLGKEWTDKAGHDKASGKVKDNIRRKK
jgi:hypothetical protein